MKGVDTKMNDTTSIANQFLEKACKKGASDIHFHPNPETNKVQVYFRLLGKRVFVKNIQRRMFEVILTYFKYRSNMDIGETRRTYNGILSYKMDAGILYSLYLFIFHLFVT